MSKAIKIILLVIIVLAIPGGVILSYLVFGKDKQLFGYTKYKVTGDGNDNAEDHASGVYNVYRLVNYLEMDMDTFFNANQAIKDVDYIPYGTIVNITK